jgi:acyl carrier protein phosphodiesterase
MNWLAHLYLSDDNAEFRVGNLLPDLIRKRQLIDLPEAFQRGIRRHRQIDAFTDAHPRVRSCVARFPAPYRRFGGILTDVYFDHLLARDWRRYSAVPLPGFIEDVYRDIGRCLPEIPREACLPLERMRQEDWLGSYHQLAGITEILKRIGSRFRRPFDLTGSLPSFQEQEAAFSADFHAFFPDMIARVQPRPSPHSENEGESATDLSSRAK